jgi:hypothetical protein
MAIDVARLRRQQVFQTPDINQGGIMGVINNDPDEVQYDAPPEYVYEDPDEQQYASPAMDPRQPVNPTIAALIGGPGSSGDAAMQRTINAINQIYTPETTSRDRYNRLLDAAPEREGPGLIRGISAGLMGLGGKDPIDTLNIQERVMFAPHMRDMQDWTAKTTPFSQAAQQENTANINERTLAGNVVTAQTQADRLAESARQADQKNEVARIIALARQATAAKYTIKEENGRVMAYPPDPRQGPPMDLGPSGLMNEREKLDLINSGRLAVEVQQGANQMAVQGSRNAGQLAVQTLRNQRITGNGGTRGLLPSQQKDAYFNRAQEWILRHPEDKANITLDPAQRSFDVNEPSTAMFGYPKGMSPENYDAFVDYIYGTGAMPPTAPQGMPTPPAAPVLPQGGGPSAPNVPQQQGQLTVPSRDDPRFQTPPGFDPHGRSPASQGQPQVQQQVQQQGQVPPTPQPVQAVNQIEQEIKQLEAQMTAPTPPAFEPRGDYARQGAKPLPVPGQQPWIYEQAKKLWEPPVGPPQPNVYSSQVMTPQGPQAAPLPNVTEVNMEPPPPTQQQQIQAKIAELRKQQEQIMNAVVTPANQQQGQPQPILQRSPSTGMQRISYDGGRTWVPYNPQAGR